MSTNITVKEAVSKGRKMLIYPPITILFGIMFLGIYLLVEHFFEGIEWVFFFFIVGGFLLAWLYWSFKVTEWRIWAFSNVRNVHHLKKVAIRNNLIGKDGSFFEKTEIRNSLQKEALKKLEKKFLEKDVFHDDPSVPKETVIYFSKAGIIFLIVTILLMALYFMFTGSSIKLDPIAAIGIGVGVVIMAVASVRLMSKKPQIILNDSGVQLVNSGMISWKDIHKEDLQVRRNGKSVQHVLVIQHHNGTNEIQINSLKTNINKLEHLMQVYRLRFEKKQ